MHILWIPHTGWHIPQRAHLFCRALTERHQVHVTDWVADFRSIQDYWSRRYLNNYRYRRWQDGSIVVHGIPRISPALPVSLLRRLNARIFTSYVQRIIARERIDVVVGTFVCPPPHAPRLVFDLFDDNVAYWRSYGSVPIYAEEIAAVEAHYLRQADAVVAASPLLADQARKQFAKGDIYTIPNGIDVARFAEADGTTMRRKLGVRGPLVGMVGSHDKPSELDKTLDAAAMLADEDISFLIAGRGTAIPAAERRAQRELPGRVFFQGYVPLEDAPDVISALDVGLCPYRKTPAADVSSPMRLLMYTAAGVPTVCTDLRSVRHAGFPNVVLVDDNAQALADGIRMALHLPRQQPPQIADYDLNYLVTQYERVLQGVA